MACPDRERSRTVRGYKPKASLYSSREMSPTGRHRSIMRLSLAYKVMRAVSLSGGTARPEAPIEWTHAAPALWLDISRRDTWTELAASGGVAKGAGASAVSTIVLAGWSSR